ncbi:MAG: DUF5131 family protein [Patescibacteria group bacterium]|jgi:protein gp37
MGKTKIEWCTHTMNPIKGKCPMACSYCYARRMYDRFHWNPAIREDVSVYDMLDSCKAGSKIFVGSTMELFGEWVTPLMRSNMFHVCELYPDLTFIFLTKQPQNLPIAFDDNCWVGVSCTNRQMWIDAQRHLSKVQAKVKFYSFEPLLGDVVGQMETAYFRLALENAGINWVIIGQQTPDKPETTPKLEWIQRIVEACDDGKIPVFLKNNLEYLIRGVDFSRQLRQQFPEVKS